MWLADLMDLSMGFHPKNSGSITLLVKLFLESYFFYVGVGSNPATVIKSFYPSKFTLNEM